MKKITLLLVIIFTFLFSTTSWGDWTYVGESDIGRKYYYDKDRVRKNGKVLYFWLLIDLPRPLMETSSVTTHTELDCSIFRYKKLNTQFLRNQMGGGGIINEFTPKDEWIYPKTNSVFESLYNKICKEHQKNYVSLDVIKSEVFYYGNRDGKFGFYTEKWEGLETEENIDYVKYEGDTVNGVPNGQGTFTWTNGKKYEGEFKDGGINGQGTETLPDGDKYVGEWKDSKRNGQGIVTYQNGMKYVGGWKDDKINGQGTLTSQDGTKYVGGWKDDKNQGQGTITFPDGTKYVGEWKNGRRDGQGTYTYDNGDVFEGEFKEGEQFNGTHYDKDRNIKWKKVNGETQYKQ